MISLYPLLLLYQPSIYPKKPTGISVVRNYLKIGTPPLPTPRHQYSHSAAVACVSVRCTLPPLLCFYLIVEFVPLPPLVSSPRRIHCLHQPRPQVMPVLSSMNHAHIISFVFSFHLLAQLRPGCCCAQHHRFQEGVGRGQGVGSHEYCVLCVLSILLLSCFPAFI